MGSGWVYRGELYCGLVYEITHNTQHTTGEAGTSKTLSKQGQITILTVVTQLINDSKSEDKDQSEGVISPVADSGSSDGSCVHPNTGGRGGRRRYLIPLKGPTANEPN